MQSAPLLNCQHLFACEAPCNPSCVRLRRTINYPWSGCYAHFPVEALLGIRSLIKATMKVSFFIAITLLVCSATEIHAQAMIFGIGNQSCGAWTQARAANQWGGLAGWVGGYFTGLSEHAGPRNDVTRGIDMPGLLAWIDNYCQAHPLNSVFEASSSLAAELLRRNHQR